MTIEWVNDYPRIIVGVFFIVLLSWFLYRLAQRQRELQTNQAFLRTLDDVITELHKDHSRAGKVDIQRISFFIERHMEAAERIWRDHQFPLGDLEWHFTLNPKEVFLWVSLDDEEHTWHWTPSKCTLNTDLPIPVMGGAFVKSGTDADTVIHFPLTPERHHE